MRTAAPAVDAATVRAWWQDAAWHRVVPVVRAWAADSIPRSYGLSGDDADDVISRVTVRMWTAPVVPDDPRAWVRVVVRNAIRDTVKSSWVKGRAVDAPLDTIAGRETADVRVVDAEQRVRVGRLREALRRLPELLRRCLVLHDLHGRTCKDVAQQMGITEGACKMRLQRARRTLAVLYARTPAPTLDARGVPRSTRARPAVRTWRQVQPAEPPLTLDPRAASLRQLYGAY